MAWPKHECTYMLMTGEEDIAFTTGVTVHGAPTNHSTYGVWVGGLEWDDAIGVHGVEKGGEVGETGAGEVGEGKDSDKARAHAT